MIYYRMFNKKKGEKKMTTCYECGEDVIYPNDAFDVISKCSNENCETHKIKKTNSLFLAEKRKLIDDLMNNEERA